MGVFVGPPPRKFKICKLMCNCLRTLRIGRYAPVTPELAKSAALSLRLKRNVSFPSAREHTLLWEPL